MKILFSTDSIARGGKERQLAILTKELTNRGYEIFWECHQFHEANYIDEYQLQNIPITFLKNRKYFKGFFEFKRILNNLKPDVIMTWDAKSSFWCLLMYRFCSWTLINGCIRHGIRKNNFSHRFRTWITKLSPYVIANSEAGLKVNLIKPSSNRKVIYNAIETSVGHEIIPNATRESFFNEITNGKYESGFSGVFFLSVANLLLIKDYPTVIEALSKLEYDFKYFIAGEGPEREKIETLILDKGLANKVFLLGRRTDISRLLSCCDIFINSSKGEGCSNAILEALAHSKYVVASGVGGTPEILPKELGELFRFQNVDSLVNALNKAFEKKDHIDFQLYQKHMEAFSIKQIVDNFEEAFVQWKK